MSTVQNRFNIAIVGGGIAGLAAATVLQKQHNVTVYECGSHDAVEAGAAIGLGPNGSKMAVALGMDREKLKGVVCGGIRNFDQNGVLIKEIRLECAKNFGSEWWFVHRQDLQSVLRENVMKSVGAQADRGSVSVVYNARATRVDVEAGIVSFVDGTQVQTDLVIGADGIHSQIRASVAGADIPPPISANLSLYRFTCPRDEIEAMFDPVPEFFDYTHGAFLSSIVASDGSNRNVVIYPCRNSQIINFACAVPDSMLRETSVDSWMCSGKTQEMLSHFADFPWWLKRIISKQTHAKLYQLRDQEPLPQYVKGRTLLIGDAAHPMTPYQGQGATQALEDAEALSLLLRTDISKDSLPQVLRTWEEVRRPRASQIQRNSRVATAKVGPNVLMQRMRFNWMYDGVQRALEQEQEQEGFET